MNCSQSVVQPDFTGIFYAIFYPMYIMECQLQTKNEDIKLTRKT